jgi:molecular chaperone GrpE (heat shock protein)
MTREDFKEYICNQIDTMSESEFKEFRAFIKDEQKEELIAQELIIIKGEFKKLTKLTQSINQKIDMTKKKRDKDELNPFISFDRLLKNTKDAIDSLPKATLFNKKLVNRSINSLQNGFESIDSEYEKVLDSIGLKRVAKVGYKFNSDFHEVVEVIEDKNLDNEIIVEVLEEGFLFDKEIINYAKVKVNRWTL